MKIDRHLLQKSGAILLVSIMLIVLTMGCASAWTITYDGNNATGGEVPVDGTNYEKFALVTVLDQNTLEKTGFIFSGWNEEADGSGMSHDPDTLIAISYNVNLYAQWEELLTVTYHAPDATAGTVPVDETTYVADDVVTVLSGSSLGRSNYIFDHWNTASDGSGTDYDADDTFTITADVDLYAIWEPTYRVSYFSNGGLIGASPMDLTKYVEGDTVTVMDPGTLGKEGCAFVEWRMESVEGTSYDPGDTFTMPGDSVTFYAIWVTAYNVTYDANEATSGTAPTDENSPYAEGATVTVLGDNGLARTGYGFLEWNTQADGNGDGYNPDDSFEISSDTTLYAIWEAVYTVTYNGNGNTGGSAPTDENTYYTDDYVSVMNIGDLVKEGFEFIHWSTVSDGSGSNYTAFQQFQIDANTILYAIWGELFHVTYDANEATGGMGPSDSTGYLSTDEITVLGPNTLVKDGYDFTGWNTQSDGTGDYYSPDDAMTITSDTTLYAIWEETLTVTYDANAGIGSEPTDSTHYHSDDEVTVTNEGELTKTGYAFVGWNTASDRSGTDYDPDDTFNINADVTLYAVWECYVVYYPNGAESGSVPVDGSGGYLEGDEVTVLGQNDLVLSDHEFMGWNTESDGTGTFYVYDETFNIDGDTDLYAMWAQNLSVTYHADDADTGAVHVDSTDYHSGDEVTVLDDNNLYRNGHVFAGWNTLSNGEGTHYNESDTFEITADVDLYAQWYQQVYVSYNPNDETSGTAPEDGYPYLASLDNVTVLGQSDLLKTGFTFSGWNLLEDCTGTNYVEGDNFTITADTDLYANWTCGVTYNSNGADDGSVPVDDVVYHNESTVSVLGQSGLSRIGFSFNGWNTESDGSGINYVLDDTFSIAGDITLYANWTCQVTYSNNSATSGTVPIDATSYHDGDYVTVFGQSDLAKTGFIFNGWNTAADGSGTPYIADDTFPVAGNTILYAQWICSVAYDDNGATSGTVPEDSISYADGDEVTVLGYSDLAKTGYALVGWNTADDRSGDDYDTDDTFNIDGNTTLYAVWECYLTYDGNDQTSGTAPLDPSGGYVPSDNEVTVLGQNDLLRTGFTFSGWNTAADGSGTNYAIDDMFIIDGNDTLYAYWTCQVIYNANSATGSVPVDSNIYQNASSVTILGQSDLERTGFTYRGWNTQANGLGTHYNESEVFTVTGNTILYAEWDEEFTVAYDGNGGTGTQTDSTIYYTGDEVTIKDTGTLVRTYFEFANWNTAADGSGTSYTEDATFTITADTTLYAQWRGYVTYDANDADLGSVPVDIDNPYMENATVTVKGQNTLSKADYIFVGWDTEADGSGTSYVEDDTFTMAGNETLYAQFDANTYESGTMTIIEFESGSLSSVITERHSTLTDVTSLTIKNGTISVADMGWIRDNLDNLETFRVIENGTFVNDTLPEFAFCDESFDAHDHITTVDLPTIDTVGAHAFRSGRISSINMPNVTTIEEKAFANSIILMDVSLPAVTSMENSAFENCGSLTNVSLPELIIVPDNGFNNCNVLVNVTIPNVTTIGNGSFSYCTALTTIVLSNVTTVGQSAFSYCDALTAINLPNATTVGQAAFGHCNNLDTAILPNVQTIEQQCFYSCDWLVTINVSNATYIGDSAFESCTMLPTISLPKVAIIDDNAFEYCTEMDNISAPLATSVGYEVFYDCYDLTTVYMPKVTDIDEYAFYESGLTKVDMPSLVNVSDSAFEDCEDLVTVSLPNVIIIENEAFESCGSLTTVDAPKVREIDYGTFLDDELLTTVNMPLLTTAGDEVFNGCGLTNISLPALTNISADMFSDCYYMTSAYLPNVIGIDAAGFYYCKNLSTMTLGSTIPVVDDTIVSPHAVGDFEVFNELPEDRILYVPATAVASYKAYNDTDPANDTWYGWTVTAIPTEGDDSSSGGGSSGGSSHYVVTQGEDSDNVESTATHTLPIHAGSKVNYDFSDSESPVIGVSFSPKQDKGTVVARVEVLSQKPDDVAESSGKFYKVMNINIGRTGTISSDNANDITIEFKVSKEWIRENNIDVSTIRLSRYHDDQWNDLPTYQEREEGEYIYFYAETPGFSVFEIVGDEITSTPVVEEMSVDSLSSNDVGDISVDEGVEGNSNFALFAIIVIVLIAGIGYFVWNNKQNKDGKQ